MIHPVLATERLRLYPWEADDLTLLVDLHGDPKVQRFLEIGGPAWDHAYLSKRLEGFRADYAAHGWTKFKVLDAQGRFIGRAGFSRFAETGELELGYSFRSAVWGQGYASEAAAALLTWIYRVEPVDHVIGFAAVEHAASRRVLEKVGMLFKGVRELMGVQNALYEHRRPI